MRLGGNDLPTMLIVAERLGAGLLSLGLSKQLQRTKGVIPAELQVVLNNNRGDNHKLSRIYISSAALLIQNREYECAKLCLLELIESKAINYPELEIMIFRLYAYSCKYLSQTDEEIAALRRAALSLRRLDNSLVRFINTTSLAYDFFDAGEEEEANDIMRDAKLTQEIATALNLGVDIPSDKEVVCSILNSKNSKNTKVQKRNERL